ncbi:hypothetical protein DRO59_00325 [Candidatus Bathyarchaeota archaeon]|nr:MAG: hypothetical protein DRO59_00325 [Candidatus Bathyarchaeota archaeon]
MVIYKCPKCGRTVEKPEGKYYCKVCGPSVLMVKVKPRVGGKIHGILATHDSFWVRVDGIWYEAETRHDALYETEEWISEILAIQRMNVKEFMEKYKPRKLPFRGYIDHPRYTREELEKKAVWLKRSHGLL